MPVRLACMTSWVPIYVPHTQYGIHPLFHNLFQVPLTVKRASVSTKWYRVHDQEPLIQNHFLEVLVILEGTGGAHDIDGMP